MPLIYPDTFIHSNSSNSVIDSDYVKGGTRTAVSNLTQLYQLSSRGTYGVLGQLKNYATRVWVISENQYYTLVDESNAGKDIGWVQDNQYANSTFFKVSGDIATGNSGFTKNVTISGTLSSSGVAYFKDAFFHSGTALALSGVFYGDGRNLLGSAFDQDSVNSWVRSNSTDAVGFNTLSAKNVYGNFLGSEVFKTNNVFEIATNTAQNSATFHGVFYGDGRRLIGSAFDQDSVNSWVRSNSTDAVGFNTLSAKNVYGDFIGTTLFKLQSATTIATNTATGSATLHGVYYGWGWELEGVDKGQPGVNSWVRSNSSVAIGFNTLSAKNVYGDFLGSEVFKTNNVFEIATNTAQSSATIHGVFYGDGRRLLGSAFDQDSVNSWVRSNSSTATGFNRLSSKAINSDFIGTTLFETQSATTIATNTAASSATFHGVYYGNGEFLDRITVGNRRFEYIPVIGAVSAHSYSGTTRSVYTGPGESLWKIVKMEYDTDGAVLGLSAAVGVSWTGRATHTYSL